MSEAQSILLGVLSGIFTSAILFISVQAFRKVIIPWYQALIYSGVKVEGDWFSKASGTLAADSNLTLKQSANKLEGTFTYINKVNGTSKLFDIAGNIRDRFVQITAKHSQSDRIGSAVYLLEVVGDGTVLSGAFCFYEINKSEISSGSVVFLQKGTDDLMIKRYFSEPKASPIKQKDESKK